MRFAGAKRESKTVNESFLVISEAEKSFNQQVRCGDCSFCSD